MKQDHRFSIFILLLLIFISVAKASNGSTEYGEPELVESGWNHCDKYGHECMRRTVPTLGKEF